MRKMRWGAVKGPALIILSPYYEEKSLGGSKGTHPVKIKPIQRKTCMGLIKRANQSILRPYHEENALMGNWCNLTLKQFELTPGILLSRWCVNGYTFRMESELLGFCSLSDV